MQQYLIATRVSVGVVECFEVIQVQMTGNKRTVAGKPLRDVSLDLPIPRQTGQGVRMFRRLYLLHRDVAEQVDSASHPEIPPVARDDEVITGPPSGAGSDQ